MDVHLAAAESDGGDAVGVEPVGVEAAVADGLNWLAADRGYRLFRKFHAFLLGIDQERLIIEPAIEPYAAVLAFRTFYFLRRVSKGLLERLDDLIAEFGIVAAGFRFER